MGGCFCFFCWKYCVYFLFFYFLQRGSTGTTGGVILSTYLSALPAGHVLLSTVPLLLGITKSDIVHVQCLSTGCLSLECI